MKQSIAVVIVMCAYSSWAAAQMPSSPKQPLERGSGNSRATSELARVLKFDKVPVIVDKPGHYVLDRSWDVPPLEQNLDVEPPVLSGPLLEIRTDDVLLDLRGFELAVEATGPAILITGNDVELRNGRIISQDLPTIALRSTGRGTRLADLTMFSLRGIVLEGSGARVVHSAVGGFNGLLVSGSESSIVEYNELGCRSNCLVIGDGARVVGNRIDAFDNGTAMTIGAGNFVSGNTIDADEDVGIAVNGDGNVLLENAVTIGPKQFVTLAIDVVGTRNVLRGNIALPAAPSFNQPYRPWPVGMRFAQDGNVYANNQMAADVPFELGATTQNDLGGNVGF